MAKQASLGGKTRKCLFPGCSERASTSLALHGERAPAMPPFLPKATRELLWHRDGTPWAPEGSGRGGRCTGWGRLPQPGGTGCRAPRFPRSRAISGRICSASGRRAGAQAPACGAGWLEALASALPVGAEPSLPLPAVPACKAGQRCSRVTCPQSTMGIPGDTGAAGWVTGDAQGGSGGWNPTVGCWQIQGDANDQRRSVQDLCSPIPRGVPQIKETPG